MGAHSQTPSAAGRRQNSSCSLSQGLGGVLADVHLLTRWGHTTGKEGTSPCAAQSNSLLLSFWHSALMLSTPKGMLYLLSLCTALLRNRSGRRARDTKAGLTNISYATHSEVFSALRCSSHRREMEGPHEHVGTLVSLASKVDYKPQKDFQRGCSWAQSSNSWRNTYPCYSDGCWFGISLKFPQ